MAFVHPSRMALVPKDSRTLPSSGTRLPSPPASPPRDRSVDRYQRRGRDEEYNRGRERRGRGDRSRDYTDRDDERRRDRGRSSDRDQDRHRSHHRSNGDRHDDRRNENRDSDSRGPRPQRDDRSSVRSPPPSSKPPLGRSSPTYDDYARRHSAPSPPPPSGRSGAPPENAPPWHQQENMYRREGRLDGGGDYFERCVALCIRLRETLIFFSFFSGAGNSVSIVLSVSGHRLLVLPHGICAYSLCSSSCIIFNQLPYRSPERDREARKRHKRVRSISVSSSTTDSEEERRRRDRKDRKRVRKERDRRKRRHRRSQSASDDEAREHHRDSRKRRSRSRSRERRKSRSRTPSPRRAQSSDEDEWVEKPAPSGSFVPTVPASMSTLNISPSSITRDAQRSAFDNDASDDDVGPQPELAPSTTKKLDERAYGGALLRGEGSAMAAFLQDGTDVRIPRRGEIGLTSGEIDTFESVGYVMSGSRHRRMNAVRMRKENQVISAEEKRGILKLQQEEKQRREAILREEFQELLTDRLKGTEGAKTS
jgi:NF-kappa-B-activating protein C-terminal domain